MRTLKLKHIKTSPWAVLFRELPHRPDRLLLKTAFIAAEYIRKSEGLFMSAAIDGQYVPSRWLGGSAASIYYSARYVELAAAKMDEISQVFQNMFHDRL